MKLYELSAAFNQVAAMMEEGTEGLEDTLESIQEPFNSKVESIIKLWRSKCAARDVIKSEIYRLDQRMKSLDKQAEWLKTYVEREMTNTGIHEVKSDLFTIKLGSNPPKVEVLNESAIPEQYMRTNISQTPDKLAIKEAIEKGAEIPGVQLVQTQSLKVR